MVPWRLKDVAETGGSKAKDVGRGRGDNSQEDMSI